MLYPFSYLAYGSNLHPERLCRRLGHVKILGCVELKGYALTFHKRSDRDGSGKCNLRQTDHPDSVVYGVLYNIGHKAKRTLDHIEGLGKGYREHYLTVMMAGRIEKAFAYMANSSHIDDGVRPFCWYKRLVQVGAHYHGFPEKYLSQIAAISANVDPDIQRREENESLLREIELTAHPRTMSLTTK